MGKPRGRLRPDVLKRTMCGIATSRHRFLAVSACWRPSRLRAGGEEQSLRSCSPEKASRRSDSTAAAPSGAPRETYRQSARYTPRRVRPAGFANCDSAAAVLHVKAGSGASERGL